MSFWCKDLWEAINSLFHYSNQSLLSALNFSRNTYKITQRNIKSEKRKSSYLSGNSIWPNIYLIFNFKKMFYLLILERGWEREKHQFVLPPYLCLHWLILVCAPTGDRTCKRGVWGRCSNQLRHPARLSNFKQEPLLHFQTPSLCHMLWKTWVLSTPLWSCSLFPALPSRHRTLV